MERTRMGLIARRVTAGSTPIVSFWVRLLCLTLQDVRRRSKRRRYWRWRAHDVPDNVVRLLLARVHGLNYGLVNGSVARCSMRGIHWIEPVTDRLPTSGHEKAHPTCQLRSNSCYVCDHQSDLEDSIGRLSNDPQRPGFVLSMSSRCSIFLQETTLPDVGSPASSRESLHHV